MANYYCTTRTNYFSVTDVEKFREIIAGCSASAEIKVWEDGGKVAFGCDGGLYGLDVDDYDCFVAALQNVLAKDEAILITEAGHETLQCVSASCVVITSNSVDYIYLPDAAMTMARELLENKDFTTKMDY